MKFFTYLGDIFSSDNGASFGRWATGATVATGCWALFHLVRHNNALPDPLTLAALAAWMTSPYSINKVAALFAPTASTPTPPS